MKTISIMINILILGITFNCSPVMLRSVDADQGIRKIDFGNFSSMTLVNKAWLALIANDYDTAEIYAKKTIALYDTQAKQMQAGLTAYPAGDNADILKYWALNDVGTAMYILADAYGKSGKKEDSLQLYHQIIDHYSYAQCWDPHGWFWKPASVAKDRIEMDKVGVVVNFGDYTSSFLVKQAWTAYKKKDLKSVTLLVNKLEELYGQRAHEMQHSIQPASDTSLSYKQDVFSHWALNDVGTGLFILADTYRRLERRKEADDIYWKIIKEYGNAECWKPLGGFWKPSDAAQKRIAEGKNRQSLIGF